MAEGSDSFDKRNNDIIFNKAEEIAKNVIAHFEKATFYMQHNMRGPWWSELQAIQSEIYFNFNEIERKEIDTLKQSINFHLPSHYALLNKWQIRLRDLCKKYGYFTMGEGQGGPAIWKR